MQTIINYTQTTARYPVTTTALRNMYARQPQKHTTLNVQVQNNCLVVLNTTAAQHKKLAKQAQTFITKRNSAIAKYKMHNIFAVHIQQAQCTFM